MKRKELQNLFPPVPGHFLDRIDRTMEEIEAMNTNSIKRIRRVSRPVLIAAIVFALTAATALAAVLGHHALKDALNASGLEDVAEQVTDIQATDASDGFCLTLDEAVWEGEKLYLSCTVAVLRLPHRRRFPHSGHADPAPGIGFKHAVRWAGGAWAPGRLLYYESQIGSHTG